MSTFRRSAVADHHGPQEFENALKDVVSTKRASVSKMTRLSEAAKRCFEVCFSPPPRLFQNETNLSSFFDVACLAY